MPTQDPKLKLGAVLEEIDMSRSAFYRMVARGKGPKIMKLPNNQIRIRRSALDDWWAAQELDPVA
ncbi:helix-turn-helix transcriptional regulator [Kitasatospora sp. NPDC052896]|uniref:helix-turn-helix transcriptional regulator n=1 Tax=Kitasatospora sp. NPDC052896 TaxID=3364061 RepID=UPI0037C9D613